MVVALHVPVHREVLLHDVRPACHGGHRNVDAAFVPGVPHGAPAELREPVHVRDVEVLVRRGVGGLALQQGERCAHLPQHGHGVQDLVLAGHPRGHDQRHTAGARVAQQPVVGEVRGGDLERGDPVLRQHLHGGRVPRRAQGVDVPGPAVLEHLEHLRGVQREPGQQVQRVLDPQVLSVRGRSGLAVEGVQVPQLELHGVRAGLLGEVHEVLGERHGAVVVVADLRDQQRRVPRAHRVPADAQLAPARLAHRLRGTTPHGPVRDPPRAGVHLRRHAAPPEPGFADPRASSCSWRRRYRSASSRSWNVSMSTPSSSAMTNRPIAPPSRLSRRS